MQADINTPTCDQLIALEKDIEQWINSHSYIKTAYALALIRDSKLYLSPQYENFDVYLQDRWDIKRRRAEFLINALDIVLEIAQCDQLIASIMQNPEKYPSREAYARVLSPLQSPLQRYKAWQTALKTGKISIKSIEEQVQAMFGKTTQPKTNPAQAYAAKHAPVPYTPPAMGKGAGGNYTPKHNIATQHGLIPLIGSSAYIIWDVLLMKSMRNHEFTVNNEDIKTITGYSKATLKNAQQVLLDHCMIDIISTTKTTTTYKLHDVQWILQANGLITEENTAPAPVQPNTNDGSQPETPTPLPKYDANNCSHDEQEILIYAIAAILCGLAEPVTGIKANTHWKTCVPTREALQAEITRENSGLRTQSIERIDLYKKAQKAKAKQQEPIILTELPNAAETLKKIGKICKIDMPNLLLKIGTDKDSKTIIAVSTAHKQTIWEKRQLIKDMTGIEINTQKQIIHPDKFKQVQINKQTKEAA